MQRSYYIRTMGCQMNVHDSDRVANLLHHAGYRSAGEAAEADLLILNTCSIREKAEHRLYSDLGTLHAWKGERPGRLLGVGGCVAQQEGGVILRRFPQVDFAFGTHNLHRLRMLLAAAENGERRSETGVVHSQERFSLPERHPSLSLPTPGRAFLTAMEGCDMFCSFCVVPLTRGREISRPAAAIVAEAEALAAAGVVEITLLGQTVNAYGRHAARRAQRSGRFGAPGQDRNPGEGGVLREAGETVGFAALLERLSRVPGIRRLRYTSPHPLFFDEALIRAHGELEALCPHVHLPAQSGSDRVLARMRRRYRGDDLRRLAERLRAARPDIAITTDLIVAFPGETRDDFEATTQLMRDVGFADSYSFKYSPRPGTAAAGFAEREALPAGVAQERLAELQRLQREITVSYHQGRVGEKTEVLLEAPSRRSGRLPGQWSGRDPQHRVVNLEVPPGAGAGELVAVEIVEATPHSLIGEVLSGAARSGASGPHPDRGAPLARPGGHPSPDP